MAPKDIMTNSHAKSILNAMNSLRKSNTLCDITLRVENTDFPAHRIVLAACSDYFCAMFTSEVLNANKEIHWLIAIIWLYRARYIRLDRIKRMGESVLRGKRCLTYTPEYDLLVLHSFFGFTL